MYLIVKCRECGKEYSSEESVCPNCGCPKEKVNILPYIIAVLGVVLVLIVVFFIVSFG